MFRGKHNLDKIYHCSVKFKRPDGWMRCVCLFYRVKSFVSLQMKCETTIVVETI